MLSFMIRRGQTVIWKYRKIRRMRLQTIIPVIGRRIHREIVRDVLGELWYASRGGPPDGVSTRGQRQHEEIIPLLSTWTQNQFGYHGFVGSEHITGGHLHIKDRRLAARAPRKEP